MLAALSAVLQSRLDNQVALFEAISPKQHAELSYVVLASDYASEIIERHPLWLQALWDSNAIYEPRTEAFFRAEGERLSAENLSEDQLMVALRQWRAKEMLRWIYRDANNLTSVFELTAELSYFADVCIDIALNFAHAAITKDCGEPIGEDSGLPQRLCVIGMGKLGAYELNLSSDIDLMFAYPEAGETVGPKQVSNQEFFIRVGQKLIRILDAQTADGFVFRVDMRLRPWGDGSALASSFAAMESYYEQHGREWERYALIKARACGGDLAQGQELLSYLSPFVYRKYIDFGAFESLREMKSMIAREVRRKGMDANIKLGAGGIREVEFIAQAFQLIRGGVDKYLQQRSLLSVLKVLGENDFLPLNIVDGLRDAYLFLRVVEHRLQMLRDQQTQTLPTSPDEQERLALSLGFADWAAFNAALDKHRELVIEQFHDVIVARDEEAVEANSDLSMATAIWQGRSDDAESWLAEHGFKLPETALNLLSELRDSRAVGGMQRVSRDRLNKLMPLLVLECARNNEPDVALERSMPLVESVLRRSVYMMMLIENRAALIRLVQLCAISPWIAMELARYPVLMDELINATTLFAPPQKEELVAELRQQLMRIPQEDLEAQMEVMRIFQKGHVLRVAASDITGTLPLMKISDYLTWIAEAVLEDVLWLAWHALVAKHGKPHRADGTPCDLDFIIVGYGKLGGIELGYGSDLDLVFVHDVPADGETDGPKPLDNATFFVRLGQKIIHFLTTATSAGILYDVDMRLRPSGSSGLLVSSLTAFTNYQTAAAWTWEHQALVRARVVAGSPELAARFNQVRAEILARWRDQAVLRAEVKTMRNKMHGHLSSEALGEAGIFALKHDRGGIVDIEFMVQYAVLAWAHKNPELTRYPDNVRILEGLASIGLLPSDTAEKLKDAYLQYRARGHRLALAHREAKVKDDEFVAERRLVRECWQALIEIDLSGETAV